MWHFVCPKSKDGNWEEPIDEETVGQIVRKKKKGQHESVDKMKKRKTRVLSPTGTNRIGTQVSKKDGNTLVDGKVTNIEKEVDSVDKYGIFDDDASNMYIIRWNDSTTSVWGEENTTKARQLNKKKAFEAAVGYSDDESEYDNGSCGGQKVPVRSSSKPSSKPFEVVTGNKAVRQSHTAGPLKRSNPDYIASANIASIPKRKAPQTGGAERKR